MKVLIVGLGSIAKKHIEAINVINPDAEIFALRRKGSSYTSISGVIDIYEPISDINFIIISNPTAEHAFTIDSLLNLEVPMFIEKPLFDKLIHNNLISKINKSGIITYVACNLRFLDCIKFLKNSIKEKVVNEVNVYCGSYLPDWRPGVDFRTIYSANKEMGGGVHIDLIHEIDYLIYLFGFPKSTIKTFRSTSSLNISAFDYANYLLLYKEFSANVVLNYYRKIPKRTIEILCEDGVFEVDLLKNEIVWNEKLVFQSKQKIYDTYIPQMRHFIEEISRKGNKEGFNNINEAYNILKLCLED